MYSTSQVMKVLILVKIPIFIISYLRKYHVDRNFSICNLIFKEISDIDGNLGKLYINNKMNRNFV